MFESVEQLDEFITRPSSAVVDSVGGLPGDFTVLGAGGKMGFHLCRMLQLAIQQSGYDARVHAVSRFSSATSSELMRQHGIETHAVDLSDRVALSRLPVTANVFFLAGVKFGTANDPELLHQMNVEMPAMVAQHFAESRITALSTGCVYSFSTPDSGGSREEDDLNPPGEYARSCLGRERSFIAGSQQYGTPLSLVRLNYSIDLRYGVLVDIAEQVLRKQAVNVDAGFVNVIWQGDAISQIIRCLPLANRSPTVMNVTGSEILSVREVADQFGQRFGCPVKFVGSEAANCWLSSSAKARALFGEPSVCVEQMIDWIADWLSRGGVTLGKPTHFQNRNGSY
ncbi:MAG: NAD(P)-dependent oxidoreductase [Rubripirellula sp.]|nr:NAD(P)-dependent oxidoreductase [Rubripirellula sp.]